MPNYTFTFKKDNIFVEFKTTDKEIVERQFQIWVADADDYAKKRIKKSVNVSSPQIKKEEKEETETFTPVAEEKPAQQETEVLDKASNLLKTINTIQNPPVEEEEKPVETVNFEEVLEKTIENPTFEPDKTQDQVFLNLIKSKNTTDKFHYLIITAYYLLEFEKMERFSLKQVNAKLMQNLSEVIDHVALQEAINQNFIELVPDLTGTSEIGEYRLTTAGEDFFANKI